MKSPPQAAGTLSAGTLKWRATRSAETRYLLYLPEDYDARSGKTWPLLVFLHGAGERGTNLQLVAVHGPPKLAKSGKHFPFIIVAPQCPEGQRWENESLLPLLDHMMRTLKVDASRVYLTGLSMGGYGTWKLGLTHPEKFAAIAPICGGGDMIDALLVSREKADALKRLPIWAFHGAKDSVVPLSESERMVQFMKKAGVAEVKLTVYPDADHNSWAETYDNPELYAWFLRHRLDSATPTRKE
ncbi:MAG TPA: prolyl oligopeptidase family serine peptidase [Verrucomicrobiae bacterium]